MLNNNATAYLDLNLWSKSSNENSSTKGCSYPFLENHIKHVLTIKKTTNT